MHAYLFLALRIVIGLGGMVLVITTLSAAIRSFVLPRNEVVRLNVWVFMGMRVIFDFAAKLANSYERRDRIMAHYAPVALVALPVFWEALVSVGYTSMFWALGEGSWARCYELSSSSLLTLGAAGAAGRHAAHGRLPAELAQPRRLGAERRPAVGRVGALVCRD